MRVNSFERRHQILDIVSERMSVSVQELSDHFNVTKVTIRTDLDELAARGLIIRTHGGASATENKAFARLFSTSINEKSEEKVWIAEEANRLIQEGETVIIDNGSTTFYLSDCIRERHLTVATGSLLVINKLMSQESIDLIILGGTLRRFSMGAIGPMTESCLEQLSANWLFLGASAVSMKDGVFCSNLVEAETKKHMLRVSDKVCLMVDSVKFDSHALGKVCSWKEVDVLVTDRIKKSDCDYLSSLGVKVIARKAE